jgi:hypothetical protein
MKKKILTLIVLVLAVAGCDATETSSTDKRPTEIAGQAVPSEEAVMQAAGSAGEEGCPAYFAEVAQVCRESINEGLDISCSTAFMSAEMAFSQKQGELFKDPNGNVSASEMGNALCAVNLRSLRKKRNKSKNEAKKEWGPKCTSFMERLEASCITPLTRAEFGGSCSMVLSRIKSLKRNESPEGLCEAYSALLP